MPCLARAKSADSARTGNGERVVGIAYAAVLYLPAMTGVQGRVLGRAGTSTRIPAFARLRIG